MEPETVKTLRSRGLDLMYSSSNNDAALLQFRKAIGNGELSSSSHHGCAPPEVAMSSSTKLNDLMGFALFFKGDYEGALLQFRIALEAREKASGHCASPSEDSVKCAHVHRHSCPSPPNMPTTRQIYDTANASALDSDLAWIYYRMGKCYYHRQEYKMAASCYTEAKQLFEFTAPVLNQSNTMSYKLLKEIDLANRKVLQAEAEQVGSDSVSVASVRKSKRPSKALGRNFKLERSGSTSSNGSTMSLTSRRTDSLESLAGDNSFRNISSTRSLSSGARTNSLASIACEPTNVGEESRGKANLNKLNVSFSDNLVLHFENEETEPHHPQSVVISDDTQKDDMPATKQTRETSSVQCKCTPLGRGIVSEDFQQVEFLKITKVWSWNI